MTKRKAARPTLSERVENKKVKKETAEDRRDQLAKDRMEFTDRNGKMLRYEVEMQRRTGAQDPINIIIGEETFVIRRGHKVSVPWYVISHLGNNVETKYRPEKDDRGRLMMIPEDQLAESFQARPINPAADKALPY